MYSLSLKVLVERVDTLWSSVQIVWHCTKFYTPIKIVTSIHDKDCYHRYRNPRALLWVQHHQLTDYGHVGAWNSRISQKIFPICLWNFQNSMSSRLFGVRKNMWRYLLVEIYSFPTIRWIKILSPKNKISKIPQTFPKIIIFYDEIILIPTDRHIFFLLE